VHNVLVGHLCAAAGIKGGGYSEMAKSAGAAENKGGVAPWGGTLNPSVFAKK